MDRNVRARQELSLLMRAAIHGVVEKIGSNPAEIQQRVALAGSAITRNLFSGALGIDQELKELALGLLHLFSKGMIPIETSEPGGFLASTKFVYPRAHGFRAVLDMARVDSERPTMRAQLLDVEKC